MNMSPLSQFDVICMMPLWLGNNEFSMTNLSFTVLFVMMIGIVSLYWLYSNQVIPSSWQVMLKSISMFIYIYILSFLFELDLALFFEIAVLNSSFSIFYFLCFLFYMYFSDFSIFSNDYIYLFNNSNMLTTGPFQKYLYPMTVRRSKWSFYKNKYKIKKSKLLEKVTDHPNMVTPVEDYVNDTQYVVVSGLSTSMSNATLIADKGELHASKSVNMHKELTVLEIKSVDDIKSVSQELNDNEVAVNYTTKFNLDENSMMMANMIIDEQIKQNISSTAQSLSIPIGDALNKWDVKFNNAGMTKQPLD